MIEEDREGRRMAAALAFAAIGDAQLRFRLVGDQQ